MTENQETIYGSGHGDGYGSGDDSGDGHGYGDGSGGDGYGDGCSDDSGCGDSSCDDDGPGWSKIGKAGDYDVFYNACFGLLEAGCEIHTVNFFKKNYKKISCKHRVKVDEETVNNIISKTKEID